MHTSTEQTEASFESSDSLRRRSIKSRKNFIVPTNGIERPIAHHMNDEVEFSAYVETTTLYKIHENKQRQDVAAIAG